MEQPVEFLDQRTHELTAWLEGVVPGVAVTVRASGEVESKQGITVQLSRVSPVGRPRNGGAPLELLLRYRVEVRLEDPLAEQRALGEIAFAALAGADYQVEADGIEGPAMAITARLVRMREFTRAPAVRRHRTNVQPGRVLDGVVLSRAAGPVANALVTIPGTDRRTYTDRAGRFRFHAIPSEGPEIKLMVWALGTQVAVDAAAGPCTTIHLPMET